MQSSLSHIHIPSPGTLGSPLYPPQCVCRLHFVLLQTLFYEDDYRCWSSFLCRHLIKGSKKSCEKEKEWNVCDDAAIAVLCLILISITTRLTFPSSSSSSLTTFRMLIWRTLKGKVKYEKFHFNTIVGFVLTSTTLRSFSLVFENVCDFVNNLDVESARSSIEGSAIKLPPTNPECLRLKDVRVNHKRKVKLIYHKEGIILWEWSHVWLAHSQKKKAKSCQSWCLYKRKIKLSNLSFVSRKKSFPPVTENLHLKDISVWENRSHRRKRACVCQ